MKSRKVLTRFAARSTSPFHPRTRGVPHCARPSGVRRERAPAGNGTGGGAAAASSADRACPATPADGRPGGSAPRCRAPCAPGTSCSAHQPTDPGRRPYGLHRRHGTDVTPDAPAASDAARSHRTEWKHGGSGGAIAAGRRNGNHRGARDGGSQSNVSAIRRSGQRGWVSHGDFAHKAGVVRFRRKSAGGRAGPRARRR